MVHGAKSVDSNSENGNTERWSWWRIGPWVAPALALLFPWVAGAPWSTSDYVFAGFLLFGSLGTYQLVTGGPTRTAYRTGIGLAVASAVLLIWVNGAVGVTDSDADVIYIAVVAVGAVGALVARFRPAGMARAMFGTTIAQALVGVVALIADVIPPYHSAFEILGITALFVVLFGGSALLFREAAREG